MALRLHTYWRSSAAYRVRIVLALKGLTYESVPRHLLRDGGEQRRPDYLALNPQGLVPALEHDGFVVGQSLAICEYLEECFPAPPLLPAKARDRATVRAMALAVAMTGLLARLGVGEIRTRADAVRSVLASVDAFLDGTVPRLSHAAADGDDEAIPRLARATQNILRALGDFRPLADFRQDAAQLVRDTVASVVPVVSGAAVAAPLELLCAPAVAARVTAVKVTSVFNVRMAMSPCKDRLTNCE
jgi:glutathione S-transferase